VLLSYISKQRFFGFVCEFEGEEREGFGKKRRSKWKKYMTLKGEDFEGVNFSS